MIREALLQEFEQQDLPSNTYYGDGSQISDSSVDAIRDAYSKEMIFFDWQKGDVLILDNMLMAHSDVIHRESSNPICDGGAHFAR